MTETLHCIPGDHDFTRERKRGVKPQICPACKVEAEGERTPRMTKTERIAAALDPELVQLYMDETLQERSIVEAFVFHGSVPPHRDVTTRRGFSAREIKVIMEAREDSFDETEFAEAA